MFDPEWVGHMLRANLHGVEFSDFQDLHAWRSLVPKVAHEVATIAGRDLLAVQTVLNENYWRQLRQGMSALGMQIVHVVLDCEDSVLRSRIENDENDAGALQWRLDHMAAYSGAREWLRRTADLVVDTTSVAAADAAAGILDSLG